jgi:UDP-N-acetylmuramoylalanine--D-glutamate ligase
MKIAVLGDGVTAKAVKNKINTLSNHSIVGLDAADYIVASPGIPPEQYPKTETPIISEIELAYLLFANTKNCPVFIGITGTNGKTTVTSLLGSILNCPVAGNIGKTLISYVPENKTEEENVPKYIVVELSSYQLETTYTFHPKIAIITNITEDHLERHKTLEEYSRVKANIFKNQKENDLLIYKRDDLLTQSLLKKCKSKLFAFDHKEDKYNVKEYIKLPGIHNQENAIVATYTALELGLPIDTVLERIKAFNGVEHRIELVTKHNDTDIYNDSKSTNPDSTITAIKALQNDGILILGGKDKNTSLDELCLYIKKNILKVILIGEAKHRFKKELRNKNYDSIIEVDNMQSAVETAFKYVDKAKYLLLSPACASFDMYKNFEDRGKHFKKIVLSLTK